MPLPSGQGARTDPGACCWPPRCSSGRPHSHSGWNMNACSTSWRSASAPWQVAAAARRAGGGLASGARLVRRNAARPDLARVQRDLGERCDRDPRRDQPRVSAQRAGADSLAAVRGQPAAQRPPEAERQSQARWRADEPDRPLDDRRSDRRAGLGGAGIRQGPAGVRGERPTDRARRPDSPHSSRQRPAELGLDFGSIDAETTAQIAVAAFHGPPEAPGPAAP